MRQLRDIAGWLANKILDKEWKSIKKKFCSMSVDQMFVGQNLDIV
jgi:hypothetical protein